MAFDAEFLQNVLEKDSDTVESRVQQIITEYNADINGLKSKNQELINSEKRLKESIKGYEDSKTDFERQIADLTEQIKSKSDDKTKDYYEAQMKMQSDNFAKEKNEYLGQIAELNKYKLNDIKSKAISEGIKGIKFVNDTMKEAFLALAMSKENFEPTVIDGQTIFLNKDKKNMSDVLKDMALSEFGRQFVANGIRGGGGAPNADKNFNGVTENPFKTGNLDEQTRLYKENRPLAIRLAKEVGIELN